jgi:hypothetical protein
MLSLKGSYSGVGGKYVELLKDVIIEKRVHDVHGLG